MKIKEIFFLWIIAGPLAFAATTMDANITLPTYANASCEAYTGTWKGFMTDPSDLFAEGGAWPVTISLYHKNGQVIGHSTAVTYAKNGSVLPAKKIWAACNQGVLSHIIWGEKGECGGVSQQGMLVSRNVMLLQLSWENAMNGANFYVFLQRVNQSYPFSIPKEKDAFTFGKRETCH